MFLTCWAVGLLVIAIGFYFHGKFLKRLKCSHAQLYIEIGEPRVFTRYPISTKLIVSDLSPGNSFSKYAEFMANKQWELLSDYELNKYVNYRRYTQHILCALFFVAFVGTVTKP